jgi:CheY-like chemotaxis protein
MTLSSSASKSILCVDDNENALLIRQEMLAIFGFSVTLAISGKAALELLEQREFDAAIIDFRMPEMDGGELTDRLRQHYPQMPVIMLTGYPHEIPPRTLQAVSAMIVKGEGPEKLLDALFRLTGAERRIQPMSVEQLQRRNIDHIYAVRRYLRDGVRKQ